MYCGRVLRRMEQPDLVAIVGGSGIRDCPIFKNAPWYEFDTGIENRFADSTVDGRVCMQIDEKKGIIFVPRHGIDQRVRHGPSRTPYRNIVVALQRLGVRVAVGTSACGSLKEHINVGDLVVPNDWIDETGRDPNLFGTGFVMHANPIPAFSEPLRQILIDSYKGSYFGVGRTSGRLHTAGVYVCIPGDLVGTEAEGARRAGYADVVGMTLCPEGSMFIQAGIHYACAAIPVDKNLDFDHHHGTESVMADLSEPKRLPAYMEQVVKRMKTFAKNPGKLTQLGKDGSNLLAQDARLIANPHVRGIAYDLIKEYRKL